MMPEEDLVGLC